MTKPTFDFKKFQEHRKTPAYWGGFDVKNKKHRYILSLLHQMGWTVFRKRTKRDMRVLPDVVRFGEFLQSDKSPVKKPLRKMNKQELSKLITALENMLQKQYPEKGKTNNKP